MMSRRSFAAALALALAGCTGVGERPQPTRRDAWTLDESAGDDELAAWAGTGSDGSTTGERRRGAFRSVEPREWWRTLPDLGVVNERDNGVTVYLAIYGPDWLAPRFRETVSLRAPVHGERAARVAFDDVDVVGARGVLLVETADGVRGRLDWDGGSSRTGVTLYLYDEHVEFVQYVI